MREVVRWSASVVGKLVAEFLEGDVDFFIKDLVALKLEMWLALLLECDVSRSVWGIGGTYPVLTHLLDGLEDAPEPNKLAVCSSAFLVHGCGGFGGLLFVRAKNLDLDLRREDGGFNAWPLMSATHQHKSILAFTSTFDLTDSRAYPPNKWLNSDKQRKYPIYFPSAALELLVAEAEDMVVKITIRRRVQIVRRARLPETG
jgi:hypothetical protein